MLFGTIDLPVLNKSIISDISYGAAADIKKNCVLLLRRLSKGGFGDLSMRFVIPSATLTKNY